ncbi:MAG: hypothetical protein Q4B28_05860 [bacterium]|nr:hypothetical protein [bacterium]
MNKQLLVTPATERNLLQLLMQLEQRQFFELYAWIQEQRQTAKGKKKAYLDYFVKFFEVARGAFLEQD